MMLCRQMMIRGSPPAMRRAQRVSRLALSPAAKMAAGR